MVGQNIVTAPPHTNGGRWRFQSYNWLCFDFNGDSRPQRASKSRYWFNSCGDFVEWIDFALWWSFIGNGLRLQPAQQACFLSQWISRSSFSSKYSEHHISQTIRARDMKLSHNVHHLSRVTCHMSPVTCQMSHVIFFCKIGELVFGGSVINREQPRLVI